MGVFKGSLNRIAGCFEKTAPLLQKGYKGNRNQFFLDYARLRIVVDHYETFVDAQPDTTELRWHQEKKSKGTVYELYIDHEETGIKIISMIPKVFYIMLDTEPLCSANNIKQAKSFVKKMLGFDDRKERKSKDSLTFYKMTQGRKK